MENIKIYRGSEWRRWDLHIHSNASDGTAIPAEIIEEAQSKKTRRYSADRSSYS